MSSADEDSLAPAQDALQDLHLSTNSLFAAIQNASSNIVDTSDAPSEASSTDVDMTSDDEDSQSAAAVSDEVAPESQSPFDEGVSDTAGVENSSDDEPPKQIKFKNIASRDEKRRAALRAKYKPKNLRPQFAKGPNLNVTPQTGERAFSFSVDGGQLSNNEDHEASGDNSTDAASRKVGDGRFLRKLTEPQTQPSQPFASLLDLALGPEHGHTSKHRLSVAMQGGNSKIHEVIPPKKGKNPPKAPSNSDDSAKTQDDDQAQGHHRHLDYASKPMSNLYEIFRDFGDRLASDSEEVGRAFCASMELFHQYGFRIFTMCSGTEAPILALDLIRQSLERHTKSLKIDHVASAEIEPFKQAYIELNFRPPLLFRDVTEFHKTKARTAYGVKHTIPTECHIVVAGSACVDYSSLNKSPKEFGKEGESWSTMEGVVHYCLKNTPALVLLENIKGAPWEDISLLWEERVDYDVKAVYVDTKDFYLPQTRQRGYMLGVNRKVAKAQGIDSKKLLDDWARFFCMFHHRASVPYTDIIYDVDTVENQRVRSDVCNNLEPPNTLQPWTACAHRYKTIRSADQIGDDRPHTQWEDNGRVTAEDYTWQEWQRNQRQRVSDTLDIADLRYMVMRDYDMAYKSRTIDLSQNIDRDLDNKHWGIVGCLTASGCLYDTYRGGPLSGREALKLQGIPVDDLSLEKLTEKQMADFAGNAMSTTVVGAALVAVIAAGTQGDKTIFFKPSQSDTPEPQDTEDKGVPDIRAMWKNSGLKPHQGKIHAPLTVDKVEDANEKHDLKDQHANAMQSARAGRQLCICEGVRGLKDTKFVICTECGHTACKTCSGNPKHVYQTLRTDINERLDPQRFVAMMRDTVPQSVYFSSVGPLEEVLSKFRLNATNNATQQKGKLPDSFITGNGTFFEFINNKRAFSNDADISELYQCIADAFKNPFHSRGYKRSAIWKIEFTSETARLELCFHPTNDDGLSRSNGLCFEELGRTRCYWLLYAVCSSEVPLGSLLREQFRNPIAHMEPQYGDLFNGSWTVLRPQKEKLVAKVIGTDPCAALQALMGVTAPGYSEIRVFRKLTIYLPVQRGQSSDQEVLDFEYLENCGTANGLLYRSTRPDENGLRRYFFLDPYHLQDNKFDQMVIAHDHSRLPRTQTRHTHYKFASGWRPVATSATKSEQWLVNYEKTDSGVVLQTATLQAAFKELEFPIWLPEEPHKSHHYLPFVETTCRESAMCAFGIKVSQFPEFIQEFGNGTEVSDMTIKVDLRDLRGQLKPLAWLLHAIHLPKELGQETEVPAQLCQSACDVCSPPPAPITWQRARRRQAKTLSLMPFEIDRNAAEREGALKSRPELAFAWLNFSDGKVLMSFHINVQSLVHRAAAPLLRLDSPSADLKVTWKMIEYDINELASPYKIPELKPNAETDPESQNPDCFKRKLWESQARTSMWMQHRETEVSDWTEQNIKDHAIKPLSRKLIAKAKRTVKVRGGILADDVGTGKTTVAYSLVGHDIDNNIGSSGGSHRVPIKATMVLVPGNLVDQWAEQAVACFKVVQVDGEGPKTETSKSKQKLPETQAESSDPVVVRKVKTFTELKLLTMKDVEDAHIIIVSYNIFEDIAYWESLRDLCALSHNPTKSGRALMQWLKEADTSLDRLFPVTRPFDPKDVTTQQVRQQLWDQQKNIPHRPFDAFGRRKATALKKTKKTKKAKETEGQNSTTEEPPKEPDSTKEKKPESTTEKDTTANKMDKIQMAKSAKEFREGIRQAAFPDAEKDNEPVKLEESPPELKNLAPLLHLFSMRRLIVDEFQYLTPRMAAAIMHMKADTRWLLSGTPPIESLDNVDQIARLLKTRITCRPEERVIKGFDGNTASLKIGDISYVEEFEEYNDIVSVETINLQNALAQDFLDKFARMNKVVTKDMKSTECIITFKPTALELAMFYELLNIENTQAIKYKNKKVNNQTLKGTLDAIDIEIHNNQEKEKQRDLHKRKFADLKTKPVRKPNRNQAILRLLSNGSCAEQVLISCYWLFLENYRTVDLDAPFASILQKMNEELLGECQYFATRAQQAVHYWLKVDLAVRNPEKGDIKTWTNEVLRDNCLGDLDVALLCDDLLGAAHQRHDQLPIDHDDMLYNRKKQGNARDVEYAKDDRKTREKENTTKISDLRDCSQRLLVSARALRFMSSVAALTGPDTTIPCSSCSESKEIDEIRLVIECGHAICALCLSKAEDSCPVGGCNVALRDHNVVEGKLFADAAPMGSAQYGTRPAAICDLLATILAKDAQNCVVVFCQFPEQAKELRLALDDRKITFSDCVGVPQPTATTKITMFKNMNMLANKVAAHESGEEDSPLFFADLDPSFRPGRTAPELPLRSRVLLLQTSSENAAGWNLQACSHVVFAAPFVARDAFHGASVHKQAVGRALRAGQKKEVFVYQFGMRYTNEITMLESQRPGRGWKLAAPVGEEEGKGEKGKGKVGEGAKEVWPGAGVFRSEWVDSEVARSGARVLVGGPPLLHSAAEEEDDDDEEEQG